MFLFIFESIRFTRMIFFGYSKISDSYFETGVESDQRFYRSVFFIFKSIRSGRINFLDIQKFPIDKIRFLEKYQPNLSTYLFLKVSDLLIFLYSKVSGVFYGKKYPKSDRATGYL